MKPLPPSAEQQLRQLREELAATQAQLRQAGRLAALGQLVAGVAHELNGPLSCLSANTALLRDYLAELPPATAAQAATRGELAQLLDDTQAGVRQLLRIAGGLKDYARPAGQDGWEWADLHQGLEATLNLAAHELRRNARLVRDYGQLPPVPCVPAQLNQVLLNLLINAAQAIDGASGTITLRTGVRDDMAWFAVSDTGAGIAAAHLPHIFDPFFTTKPAGVGCGLGLALSRDIVRQHGGRIEVDSAPGQGSTFRVLLPLRRAAREAA
ncbi:signal transduction histidine kinase [Duganella sp. SG902]|uniref:sensor histidine kinase n=1 Tax=Duganella sp. SG902 TaxID=2587016 RepID=UPI00159D6EEB|nr:ATP-binding protein [Duganella sp. SG902]NVM80016.1 signal transduction histidine kinase [Duganella sp. SG902]